jgi:hypothetical protein
MDNGNGGMMGGEASQMTELMPGYDCEMWDTALPGVGRLHISRVIPVEAGCDGMCAVVITADVRTAREAEAFRDAIFKLARGRLGTP